MHAGGDWGSAITSALGGLYPEHCRAIHINMCFAAPSLTNPWHVLQVSLFERCRLHCWRPCVLAAPDVYWSGLKCALQLANAKLPVANWFPLFISWQEMNWLKAGQAFQDKETGEPAQQLHDCICACMAGQIVRMSCI